MENPIISLARTIHRLEQKIEALRKESDIIQAIDKMCLSCPLINSDPCRKCPLFTFSSFNKEIE